MKVLIFGGGYTGQRLARWLIERDIGVHLTNRTGVEIADLPVPMFTFAYRSATDYTLLPAAALTGVTHVLSTIAPTKQGTDPVLAIALNQLQASPLQWFGYLSTTGVLWGYPRGLGG